MALILNEKYNRPHDYGIFIWQRFLRIYPTYAIILVIIMVTEAVIRNGSPLNCWDGWIKYGPHLSLFSAGFLALINIIILGQDWTLFLALNPDTGNLYGTTQFQHESFPTYVFLFCRPSWSLGLELLFYLMAPFLVRRSVKLQLSVIAASLGLRLVLAAFFHLGGDPWSYRFFPTQLGIFMAGSVGYQAYRCYGPQLAAFMKGKSWLAWIYWLSIFVYSRIPGDEDIRANCFLALTAIMVPVLFVAYQKNAIDRAIGELSYPLYLLHFLVLYLFAPIYHNPFYSVACITFALLAAYLFYHFIEGPLENYRASLFRRERKKEAEAVQAT